jgi:hypothetical protein
MSNESDDLICPSPSSMNGFSISVSGQQDGYGTFSRSNRGLGRRIGADFSMGNYRMTNVKIGISHSQDGCRDQL